MPYEQWPYLGLFAVLIAASLGLPLPEDIPLLTGGYLCHRGLASVPIMIAVGMTGVLSGDVILFTIGRRLGHHVVRHRFFRRLVSPKRLLMAEELFAKHGVKILFFGRFAPGLRPMIFMAAGVLRVRFLVFLAVNGSAACISVPTLVLLAYFFGERIERDVRVVSLVIAAVIVMVAAGLWLHHRQRRLMAATHLPPDVGPDDLDKIPPHPLSRSGRDHDSPDGEHGFTETHTSGDPSVGRRGLTEPAQPDTTSLREDG